MPEQGVAGIVLGAFGIGMLVSSIVVSRRNNLRQGVNFAIFIGVGLGLGQFLVSFASTAWIALAIMFAWGLGTLTMCVTILLTFRRSIIAFR